MERVALRTGDDLAQCAARGTCNLLLARQRAQRRGERGERAGRDGGRGVVERKSVAHGIQRVARVTLHRDVVRMCE
jgi:hypothetical protein